MIETRYWQVAYLNRKMDFGVMDVRCTEMASFPVTPEFWIKMRDLILTAKDGRLMGLTPMTAPLPPTEEDYDPQYYAWLRGEIRKV